MAERAARLLEYVRTRHPRALRGVMDAQARDEAAFTRLAELFLGWAEAALGEEAIPRAVDAFVAFSNDVNFAQARYEAEGSYEHKSYEECRRSVYDDFDRMSDYLWGVYLTNFLWAHHVDLSLFFEERFLARLPRDARIVEIAPGHGGWGLWAIHSLPGAQLSGFDISPSSLAIARQLAQAAGLAERACYSLKDVLELTAAPSPKADACICCFLVEHLEQPHRLFETIHHILAPGGIAFVTGALTAAQVDHIFEFRKESELVMLAEANGMRVLETRSVGPMRTLPKALFLPRSMALILVRHTLETW